MKNKKINDKKTFTYVQTDSNWRFRLVLIGLDNCEKVTLKVKFK